VLYIYIYIYIYIYVYVYISTLFVRRNFSCTLKALKAWILIGKESLG